MQMPTELPTIQYPPELPVSQRRDDLARAIREHQVVIVAGETGSGKTTQLPKICLELGRERIGHTQPRRIAARSVAERIASELGVDLGGLIGYQVRFDDRSARDTRVKLMTDGVLLAELARDRELRRYDTIIIDEAHERSLTIDFLIGYLKRLLPRRPELKVIVTSATIDPESFAAHFADAAGRPAPIVEVSGRTFPVEVRYRPLVASLGDDDGENGLEEDVDAADGVLAALAELDREAPGDVLVFFSGESEIRDAEEAIRGRLGTGPALSATEVLPLYGRLSAADQHRVFSSRAPGVRRRIVLATNVAETSLTVPGIKYVIDTGLARVSRYSARSKVQRLPIEAVSQASANQRSGRAGRTSDGIAIRLYAEDDFLRRPEFTDPEILRTNLAAVILQMLSLGLGDIASFPFLQPPDSRGIKDGLELLVELGAVEPKAEARITPIGREIARLPVDPRFGRMLVEAKRNGVGRAVTAIVAGLSIQDPRERPLERRQQADALHARFADPTSDFLTLLRLWEHLEQRRRELSGNAFRRECRAEYLNYLRVREWHELVRQLEQALGGRKSVAEQGAVELKAEVLSDLRRDPSADARPGRQEGRPKPATPRGSDTTPAADIIHRSILAGLLSRIGLRDTEPRTGGASQRAEPGRRDRASREYLGARSQRFTIFPGSGLAKKPPAAVMAAELVETSRLFARTVAAIDPAWAEELAGPLAKRSWSEPHWEKRQGSAVAWERVTLYGVPLVPRRRIQLARVDAALARELFIRHALVQGEWDSSRLDRRLTAFDRANRALRGELESLEERSRRRDILHDDEAVFDFYDARIPAEVHSTRAFETWWRTARRDSPELLGMAESDLAVDTAIDDDAYPTEWRSDDQTLRLAYRFEPGADDDGVTTEVPLALLARVETAGFDWLVPGLREELVTALLKTLPKAIRRNVVPAADWARRLLDAVPDGADLRDMPLTEFLAREIRRQTHTPVDPDDFEPERLSAHLRMRFAVVDERGATLAASTELGELQRKLAGRTRDSVARVAAAPTPNAMERRGLTGWDFGTLPRTLDAAHGANTVRAYPALVDEGASVAVRLLPTVAEQARAHRAGVRRMLLLGIPSPLAYVQEQLSTAEKLILAASPYRSTAALLDDCLRAVVDERIGEELPFDRAGFETLRDAVNTGLIERLFETVALTVRILAGAREIDRAISAASSIQLMALLADARAQLDALVFDGFVARTGLAQLPRVPVYLAGLTHRLERMAENPGRDRAWLGELEQAVALYEAAGGTLPLAADAAEPLRNVRWMLEEFRLSLFSQQLRTTGPVSLKRIRAALAAAGPGA